ncbi:unnamed protein product [Hydatigera taeniaeformis]|uniref:Uncharacterized protein n=1 Tax=Hydatigena taeniaeformis TaxID=6205 RepID=A0A3P7ERL0_HYDTA|nr:unnamed protein product [Hydatigera taeniaeformis]
MIRLIHRKKLVLSDPEQQPKLIIFSASSADVKEIPREINTSAIRGISLLCDCIRKDPTGNTWHSCTYRFGCRPGRRSTTDQLCASGNDDLYILVLHKSLLWYQKRLKIAFLVKLSNGSLSMFFLPPSLCYQLPLGGDGEAGTSRRKMTASTMMNQGCVYSAKALPVTAMASDARLTRAACKLWSSLADSLRRNEQLAQFVALNDAPNELNLFLLKRTPKFQLVLEMTAFSETTVLSPYSFPSGSLIAERILASNQDIQNDNEDRRLSTVFVVLVESAHCQDAVCLVFCSTDAVTPLTLLISSDHLYPWVTLAYGHHWSYRVRVSIFGAIVDHVKYTKSACSSATEFDYRYNATMTAEPGWRKGVIVHKRITVLNLLFGW